MGVAAHRGVICGDAGLPYPDAAPDLLHHGHR
jgi:hypothetical protein